MIEVEDIKVGTLLNLTRRTKMKNYTLCKIGLILISAFLVGCNAERVFVEKTYSIEVMLVGGGSATLTCPLHKTKPFGAHGRECYLSSTPNKIN